MNRKNLFVFHNIRSRKINFWLLFYFLVYIVLLLKLVTVREIDNSIFFASYSVLVSFYILSRFLLAYFYEPITPVVNKKYTPSLSFSVPAKNEVDNIRETIIRIAKIDYPKNKFDIIAVSDGSTDDTYKEMLAAQKIAGKIGVKVIAVNWKVNKGKRHGMAEAIKRSKNDLIVFIDSDSFVESNTARELAKYFIDEQIAAVAGHAYVANENKNILTKMQAVRYYVAFKAYKSAEALFGAVTCCSGCCSAYRRKYVLEVADVWLNQTFLGVRCTYGDDRSLTNQLLRKGYKAVFSPTAISHTFVPDTFSKFMRQQLRWKKSWVRESFIASGYMWKKNPIMSFSYYSSVILTFLAPIVVARSIVWYPLLTGNFPYYYIFGLCVMATIYGLYYRIHIKDGKWIYGVAFSVFYTLVLIWQLPWAILNLRDPAWGTR